MVYLLSGMRADKKNKKGILRMICGVEIGSSGMRTERKNQNIITKKVSSMV